MRETRKTVLFIVEGSSDKTALEKIFKKIYRRNRNIEFRFTSGDISTDPKTTIENVEKRIYTLVKAFLDDKKLKRTDLWGIVQLFDMDGAFIPESAIVRGPTYRFTYSTTNISCTKPERVKERNKKKSTIINYLLTKHDIENISYEMFFMSCDLDHALYDQQNLAENLKQQYADKFYERFYGKEHLFPDFIKTDVVNGVPDDRLESWRYIKEKLHSLERHTNLHIYFLQHPIPDGLL